MTNKFDESALFSEKEIAHMEAVAPTPKKYAPNSTDKNRADGSKSGTLSDETNLDYYWSKAKNAGNWVADKAKPEIDRWKNGLGKIGQGVADVINSTHPAPVSYKPSKTLAPAKTNPEPAYSNDDDEETQAAPTPAPKVKSSKSLPQPNITPEQRADYVNKFQMLGGKFNKDGSVNASNLSDIYNNSFIARTIVGASDPSINSDNVNTKIKQYIPRMQKETGVRIVNDLPEAFLQNESFELNLNILEEITIMLKEAKEDKKKKGRPSEEASYGANMVHINAKRAADNMSNVKHKFENGDVVHMTKNMGVAFLNRHSGLKTSAEKLSLTKYAHQSPEAFEKATKGGKIPNLGTDSEENEKEYASRLKPGTMKGK